MVVEGRNDGKMARRTVEVDGQRDGPPVAVPSDPIGRVVATERLPASPHQFHFWTEVETPIGIGAIVRVEGRARTVYAVVVDAKAYSDLADPLHEVRAAAGIPGGHVAPFAEAAQ